MVANAVIVVLAALIAAVGWQAVCIAFPSADVGVARLDRRSIDPIAGWSPLADLAAAEALVPGGDLPLTRREQADRDREVFDQMDRVVAEFEQALDDITEEVIAKLLCPLPPFRNLQPH